MTLDCSIDRKNDRDDLQLEYALTDHQETGPALALSGLGWSEFFSAQVKVDEAGLQPMRIANVHRSRLNAMSQSGPVKLTIAVHTNTGDFAVGDWVLAAPQTHQLIRRLQRRTVLVRGTEGSGAPQLAAANVDTLFIVTSCNADFSEARLERYLAMANEAGTVPVIVLTKADSGEDAGRYRDRALLLQRNLDVAIVDPRSSEAVAILAPWCGAGQTVALVGSSGVGKSTLVNTLAGPGQELPQETGEVRGQDSKGRHTTTSRSLHAIGNGGWVIDTPGIRSLDVSDAARGIEILFAEITELAPLCRFRDCTHDHEPGCAVQAAVTAGTLDPERLARWRKLREENRGNTQNQSGTRRNGATAGRGKSR